MRWRLKSGIAASLGTLATLGSGCADVLGFKTFTETHDGGAPRDGSLPPPPSDGATTGPGGDGAPGSCSPPCASGQACANGTCVCDPATCTGCCSGTACSTSWPGCGTGGGACAGCDSRTDRCDQNGACACGSTGPCAAGLQCVGGGCQCDATSCTETCCGDACIATATDPANCGACGHSCLGAACSNGLCVPASLATHGTPAWAMAIGSSSVFWLSSTGAYSCPLAGCGASPAGPFASARYTFDAYDLAAYYESDAGPSLLFASGDTPPPVQTNAFDMTPDGGIVSVLTPLGSPTTWLLDTTGFYWVGGSELDRRPIGGSKSQLVIIDNLSPGAAALAADAHNVYVADSIQVVACPKPTGQCGSATTLIANVGSPVVLATMPSSEYVYSGSSKAIYRCPYRGCTDPQNVPIFSGADGMVAMVADDSALYWTDAVRGTVMKCAHGAICNTPTTVASGLNQPWGIAVDASWVYWTLAGGSVAAQRVAK